MAIWWVDPYKNAPIGGGNGTTSTGTSDGSGTYSDPFSFGYVFKPACYNQWAANDEVRFKGLSESTFFPETAGSSGGSGLYSFDTIQSYYEYTNPDDNSTTNIPLAYPIDGSVRSNNRLIRIKQKDINSKTGKVFYFKTGNNMDSGRLNTVPYAGYWTPPVPLLDETYGYYVMNPDYSINSLINWNDGNTGYGLKNLTVNGIKITSGWDSSTTQNGITLIDAQNSSYFNSSTGFKIGYNAQNSSTHRLVDWDCGRMIWYVPENVSFEIFGKNIRFKSAGTGYCGGYSFALYAGVDNASAAGNSDLGTTDVGNINMESCVGANGPQFFGMPGLATSSTIDIPFICSAENCTVAFYPGYDPAVKTFNLNLDQLFQSYSTFRLYYGVAPPESFNRGSTINLNLPIGWNWATQNSSDTYYVAPDFLGTINVTNYDLSGDYMWPQQNYSPTNKSVKQYSNTTGPLVSGWSWQSISISDFKGIDYSSFGVNDKLIHNSTSPFKQIYSTDEPGDINFLKSLVLEDSGSTLENITKGMLVSNQYSPFANPKKINILTAGSDYRNVQLIYRSSTSGTAPVAMYYNSSNFSYNKTLKIFSNSNNNSWSENYFLQVPNSVPNGVNFSATYTTSASPGITFTPYIYGIDSTTGDMVALTTPTVDVVGTSINVTASYTSGDLSSYTKTLVYIWQITKNDGNSAEISFTTNPTITAI